MLPEACSSVCRAAAEEEEENWSHGQDSIPPSLRPCHARQLTPILWARPGLASMPAEPLLVGFRANRPPSAPFHPHPLTAGWKWGDGGGGEAAPKRVGP
jgi:hypothetical protein